MRGIIAVVLAALAVLYSLIVLLSADRTANSRLATSQGKIADSGTRFLETILLHRQRRSTDHRSAT